VIAEDPVPWTGEDMNNSNTVRRAFVLGAIATVAGPLMAQTAGDATPRYAVLSIIGDQLTLVGFKWSVGSNLNQNVRRVVPIGTPVLDNSTLLAVDDAVRRVDSKAKPALLASRDPSLFALRDQALDEPGEAAAPVAAIKTLLQKTGATRLILVAPHRANARFPLQSTSVGTGQVAGLGLYVDPTTVIQMVESGAQTEGFIAPYAYFSVSLIDAQSMKTIRRQLVTESEVFAAAEAKDAIVPWDILSNDKKVERLQVLIRRGVERVVPALLAGA
jgi:hypothetical protein